MISEDCEEIRGTLEVTYSQLIELRITLKSNQPFAILFLKKKRRKKRTRNKEDKETKKLVCPFTRKKKVQIFDTKKKKKEKTDHPFIAL